MRRVDFEESCPGGPKRPEGKAIRLKLKVSSHTPLHDEQAEEFADIMADTPLHDPERPMVSNITAELLRTAAEVRHEFEEQLTELQGFLSENWTAKSSPKTGNPMYERPVVLVVPYSPGGGVDTMARHLAKELQRKWGQSVVVENRVGAGGTVGAQDVLRSPADGYTLINVFMPMTVVQTVMADVNYQLARDFAAIGQFAWSYNVLVVPPSLPAKSVRELIELARRQPGKLNYGSAGIGTASHIPVYPVIAEKPAPSTNASDSTKPRARVSLVPCV